MAQSGGITHPWAETTCFSLGWGSSVGKRHKLIILNKEECHLKLRLNLMLFAFHSFLFRKLSYSPVCCGEGQHQVVPLECERMAVLVLNSLLKWKLLLSWQLSPWWRRPVPWRKIISYLSKFPLSVKRRHQSYSLCCACMNILHGFGKLVLLHRAVTENSLHEGKGKE